MIGSLFYLGVQVHGQNKESRHKTIESLYLHYLDGRISREMYESFEARIKHNAAYPGFQAWWSGRREWYQPSFRARLDEKFAGAKTLPPF